MNTFFGIVGFIVLGVIVLRLRESYKQKKEYENFMETRTRGSIGSVESVFDKLDAMFNDAEKPIKSTKKGNKPLPKYTISYDEDWNNATANIDNKIVKIKTVNKAVKKAKKKVSKKKKK